MNFKKLFGLRLRELRKNKKLSQAELAEQVCVDPKHISFLETGRNFPSTALLERLAVVLEVEIQEMFNFSHNKDRKMILCEIQMLINELDDEKLKLAHRILFDIAR